MSQSSAVLDLGNTQPAKRSSPRRDVCTIPSQRQVDAHLIMPSTLPAASTTGAPLIFCDTSNCTANKAVRTQRHTLLRSISHGYVCL